MALNVQQRGLLRVNSSLEQRVQPNAERIGRLPSSGGAEAASAAAAASASISSDLARLGREIGSYADHAAAAEGRQEGHLAGMDPEFRPRNDGTIRGEAFDKAGFETFKSNMAISIASDIADAKSADEVERKRAGWLSRTPQDLAPEVNQIFNREILTKRREEVRAAAARQQSEAVVSLAGEIETLTKGLHQRAFSLGLDATADTALASEVAQLQSRLQRIGPDGKPLLSPESVQKVLRGTRETIADARVLGAFDRLGSTAERAAFIQKFEDDFASSKGLAAQYDFQRFERLQGQLRAHLNQARSEERQSSAAALETIKGLGKLAEKGFSPSDDQLAAARALAATAPDPEVRAQLEVLEQTAAFQKSARTWTPEQLDAYAAERRRAIERLGPTAGNVHQIEMAERLAAEQRRALKTDPLGWADRVGVVKIEPVDLSSPETASATLTQRIVQAEEVARKYGIAPVYLRPDEITRWATVASQGGAALTDIAQRIATGAGDRAEQFLAQVADQAPVVAHIGDHVRQLGNTPVAADVANGLALMKTEGFKGRAPSIGRAHELAVGVHKKALSGLPSDESALIVATNAAYEIRAQRKGLTEFDADEWQRTFLELLGERRDTDGTVYGGIANSRARGWWGGSSPVVVPPNVKQDAFRDVVHAIRVEDFGDAPPRFGDGRPVTAKDLRGAALLQAGDGRYWINIGSDASPVLLRNSVDRTSPFVLDLKTLEPKLKERVPDAYFGGKPTVRQP
jgi:hypothetical protein